MGWYDAEKGGNYKDGIDPSDTGNVTVYAQWEQIKVDVRHNITYPSSAPDHTTMGEMPNYPTDYLEGSGVDLPQISGYFEAKPGYKLVGWTDSAGNVITSIPATATTDYVLGVKVEPITIYLELTENEYTGTETGTFGSAISIPTPALGKWEIYELGKSYSGGDISSDIEEYVISNNIHDDITLHGDSM